MIEPARNHEADRLLETMLDEAMDRLAPPDLTARIARELASDADRTTLAPTDDVPQRKRRRTEIALAAAALAFVSALVWSAFDDEPRFIEVELTVLRGDVHFESQRADFTARRGDVRHAELTCGDRIHSDDAEATLRLRPLGILNLRKQTTLEIDSMTWTTRDGVLMVSSVTIGALAGAFTWNAFAGGRTIEAGESAGIEVASRDGSAGVPLTAQEQDLRKRLSALEKDNADLRLALGRKKLDETTEDLEAPTEATPQPIVAAFGSDEFAEALAKVDWTVMGESMRDMVPLLALLAGIEDFTKAPPDVIAKISKLNSGLIEQAAKIMNDVPGTGVNGSFTHPVFAANQISAALASAGLGLTDAQRASLEKVMRFHAAKDKSLRLSEDSREFKLQTLIEEMAYKDQFYTEARSLLTPEQQAKLYNSATQGRSGLDLFGPGIMTQQYSTAIRASSTAEFTSSLANNLASKMNLAPAARKQLDAVIGDWAKGLPAGYWKSGDGTEHKSSMRVSRIRNAAARQVQLMRSIANNVNLSPEVRKALLANMMIFVPLPK